MWSGPLPTHDDLERCAYVNQEQKRLKKVYQDIYKNAKKVCRQIDQDKSHVFIRLLKEHFGNVKSHLKKQRKLPIASSAYVPGLSAPSLAGVKKTDCLSIEDIV